MTLKKIFLTSSQYAQAAGLTVTEVTGMLRNGQIAGEKMGNRWRISSDQLSTETDAPFGDATAEAAEAPPVGFTVSQFESMTYLTAQGVEAWLRSGRLKGRRDVSGQRQVDAASLELPDVRRLLRRS